MLLETSLTVGDAIGVEKQESEGIVSDLDVVAIARGLAVGSYEKVDQAMIHQLVSRTESPASGSWCVPRY